MPPTTNTYDPLKSYLTSQGQSFSQANLNNLAVSKGIKDYANTDAQNTQLAGMLTPASNTPITPNSSSAGGVPINPPTGPVMNDIYGDYNSYTENPNAYLASKGVSEAGSRAKSLAAMQAQIDSTNNFYADQLRQAQIKGQGNLGSSTAIQARRGLLGSDFGAAQTEGVNQANTNVYNSIENEKQMRINELLSSAETSGIQRYKDERAAIESGLKSRIEYLKGAEERKKTGASDASAALIAGGYNIKDLTPEQVTAYAKGYGTTESAIKSAFDMSTYKTKQEETKRQQDIADALVKKGVENVSQGTQGFFYNPKTQKYDLVANNPKTYAPKAVSGGAGVGGTVSGGKYGSDLDATIGNTLAIIPSKFGQATFSSQIAKARNDSDKINTIASVVLSNAPAAERTDFTNQAKAIKQLDQAIAMIDNGTKTGVLKAGQQYVYNLAGKDYDPNLAKINQLVTSAIQPYRNSITGAAWGDQEDAEYQNLFGSTKYSPAEFKQRLQGVKDIMKNNTSSALNAYVNPMNTTQNYFDPTTQTSSSQVEDTGYNYEEDLASAQRAIQSGRITKEEASRIFNEKYSGNTQF